jgi:acetylornithine deacetylase
VGHKGKTALKAICHGRAAHSAAPARGVNAIYMASQLIGRIRQRQQDIEASGLRDPAYEVPYTTLHVGVIQGGSALNIIPARCELEFEVRNLSADDPALLIGAIRADAEAVAAAAHGDADARIELELMHEYPGLETPGDSEVITLAAALTGNHECIKVGFGSEAGLFSGRLGIPTVVCGPGSIEQAHRPDEFITMEQLQRCDAMMDALLDRLA